MPDRFDLGDFANNAAEAYTSIAKEIAGAAKNVYCQLVQNSPFSVMYNNPLTSPIVKRAITSLCGQPPPEQPPPPFEGGQCVPVLYRVTFKYRIADGAAETTSGQNVWGSVRGLYVEDANATAKVLRIKAGDGSAQNNERNYDLKFAATSQNPFPSYSITNVVRVDGQEDNCGNPPRPWYPETEPPPPDITNNVGVSITNNEGDTNNFSVTVNRDGDNHVKFPPIINVNGVSVGIDVTGINVGDVSIDAPSGGGGGGGGNGNDNNLPSSSSGDGEEVETEELPEEELEGAGEATVEKLVAVIITINQIPKNAKIVSGRGAPNIIYAGWIEFRKGADYYPRTYIDFNKGYFPAPNDADGYAVTLKQGYTGKIKPVIEKQSEGN